MNQLKTITSATKDNKNTYPQAALFMTVVGIGMILKALIEVGWLVV